MCTQQKETLQSSPLAADMQTCCGQLHGTSNGAYSNAVDISTSALPACIQAQCNPLLIEKQASQQYPCHTKSNPDHTHQHRASMMCTTCKALHALEPTYIHTQSSAHTGAKSPPADQKCKYSPSITARCTHTRCTCQNNHTT